MTELETRAAPDRLLPSGDEAGTAPEDRAFRPDVEGLRAVAVLLVVLLHAGVPGFTGGYVGVDVFFVISGFVITGVLLRERASTGRNSILAFYGRRCRRIIPAAALVIVATVFLAYALLGIGAGTSTVSDARWASIFLANFHFASFGTNYLNAQQPPSPLQNFWSLAVEEQFYLVYPALFIVLASMRTRLTTRGTLMLGLTVVAAASFAYSVIDTSANPTAAYFSPLTRAWELALGALVALATPWLRRLPRRAAAVATWAGLGAIVLATVAFGPDTLYPGAWVAVPVLGAAALIAGGAVAPALGVESVLRLAPVQALGRLSYSLYLWHWPLLVVAAEYQGRASLSVGDNLVWVAVALGASVLMYRLLEQPVRHARVLRRTPWRSIAVGLGVTAVALGVVTVRYDSAGASVAPTAGGSPGALGRAGSVQSVLHLVASSGRIRTVPADLLGAIARPQQTLSIPPGGCFAPAPVSQTPECAFGDAAGTKTMVLYGDSHAAMWFRALDNIASADHWRLVVLTKASCPAAPLSVPARGVPGRWVACDQWHRHVLERIDELRPALLVVSQAHSRLYSSKQWKDGLERLLDEVRRSVGASVVLGDVPPSRGADCLSRHVDDVQACSTSVRSARTPYDAAEQLAAEDAGARYVDLIPWFCATTCSPIIGDFSAYSIPNHVSVGYSVFLQNALATALSLSPGQR